MPTRHLLDAQSRHAPVWRYRFDAPSPGAPADKSGFRGADIPFVWNVALDAATDQQRHLSTEIRRRWISFITTGTPNLDDLAPWARYSPDSGRSTMLIDLDSRAVPTPTTPVTPPGPPSGGPPEPGGRCPPPQPARSTDPSDESPALMSTQQPTTTPPTTSGAVCDDIPSTLYRKIAWRLLPVIAITYAVAIIDRVNIGFAKLQMSPDIGLSAAAYGLGAGIFFLAYCLFEMPSNIILERVGARRGFRGSSSPGVW
ncbi:carboxylesterase family protein [Rhodococcus sp. WB9]|uniref:carboxylesterase family protein n=1 Tax=Rhodococcus sp. WB9 TaxID=2594007 RepID=UPI0021B334F8|nr:carboxylesterase family protein [Rhodococcus sp. WB9]